MYARTLLAMTVVCAGAWTAEEEAAPRDTARKLGAVLEVVQKHHVEPPERSELIRSVLTAAGAPADAAIPTDEAEFSTRLAELYKAPRDQWVTAISDGLSKVVPGAVQYVPESEYKVIEQVNANRYVGTGIQIRVDDKEKLPSLVYCFPGGPAHKAGGKHGDIIVAVDGKKVEPGKLGQAVQWLRGDEGTAVTMTVRRPGETETRDLKMVRSVVPFMTVEGYRRVTEAEWTYRVDSKQAIAYLRIDAVRKGTLHELRQAEQRLKADGCRALVLDLRQTSSDTGGDSEAALVADALLDHGVLWRVRDARGNVRELKADADCLFRGWPIAVLIGNAPIRTGNAGTLIAAALKDNGRAVLVGEPNVVEPYLFEFIRLPDRQGVVRLATARVERNGVGDTELSKLQPDAPVKHDATEHKFWSEWRHQQTIGQKLDEPPPKDPVLDKAIAIVRDKLASSEPAQER